MRKKVLIVPFCDRASSVLGAAPDMGVCAPLFVSDPPDVVISVLEFKPELVLFEIVCWQKPLENLLSELMNLKSSRSTRKIILSDNAGLDDKVNRVRHAFHSLLHAGLARRT